MLLSAGLGSRMLPLTRDVPKPMLQVQGKSLIMHHITKLAQAEFTDVVVNLHYRGEQIRNHLGDGSGFGIRIHYSNEPDLLETAGGIKKALPVLGDEPFAVISSDIFTVFDFQKLHDVRLVQPAHLMMVDNPGHHPNGDFAIDESGLLRQEGNKLTWASMGVFTSEFFVMLQPGKSTLRALFDRAIGEGQVSGEHISSFWTDVGTPQRYEALNRMLDENKVTDH